MEASEDNLDYAPRQVIGKRARGDASPESDELTPIAPTSPKSPILKLNKRVRWVSSKSPDRSVTASATTSALATPRLQSTLLLAPDAGTTPESEAGPSTGGDA